MILCQSFYYLSLSRNCDECDKRVCPFLELFGISYNVILGSRRTFSSLEREAGFLLQHHKYNEIVF